MTCNEIYNLYLEHSQPYEIYNAYKDVDVTDCDEKNGGYTPLHLACRFADSKAVSILLERGVDVNVKDNNGFTPLCTLASCRNERGDENELKLVAKMLITSGAKIPRSGKNTTALIEAVRNRHFGVAETIVESGSKINSVDGNGENALHHACLVALFISSDRENYEKLLEKMKNEGWHPEKKINETKDEFIKYKNQEKEVFQLVKLILENGTIDLEEKSSAGKRPIDIALEHNVTAISALLSGNDPEEDELIAISGGMNIFQAIINRNTSALDAILRMGTDLQVTYDDDKVTDFKGKSPLACALMWSDFVSAEMILKAGADPNWRMPDEKTAFAVWAYNRRASATEEENYSMLQLMSEFGWDVEQQSDNRGNTALGVACLNSGHGPCNTAIRFLLNKGVDANIVNSCGQTPLMLLCGGNYWDGKLPVLPVLPRNYPYGWRCFGKDEMEVFEPILEAGASILCKDNWGNTILHYLAACCKGPEMHQVSEILEDFGLPDLEAVNDEGLSALDVAIASNNEDMIKYLLKKS